MWTVCKVFIEVVAVLLLLYVFWVLGHKAYGILAPQPGIELILPALGSKVLTTGPPGKSLHVYFSKLFSYIILLLNILYFSWDDIMYI